VGGTRTRDSLRGHLFRLRDAQICSKNRSFLTRLRRDATYSLQFVVTAHPAGLDGRAQQ